MKKMKMMIRMVRTMMIVAIVIASLCNNMSVVVNGFVTRAPGNSKYLSSSSSVLYAGFGGGGGEGSNNKNNNKKNKKKKINKTDTNKMKPKVQWDRYLEFKYEPKIAVAVQIITDADADAGEWLNVGCVKSKDSKYTSQAVFRQRGIIAEHAKRLHPIQLATNGKQQVNLRWAYYDFPTTTTTAEKEDEDEKDTEEEGHWMIVDKSTISGTEDVVELDKLIGFMGRPDPVTGFYCQYEGGRITSNPLSSNGQEGGKSGSGGPVTGSNKKGPGDGVI
mmetsp:Transcript_35623/g.40922  ORF Transcript_35623/g.40922 Transcript_35623/m.40922 type:complete len:276 (+) Transcript_35623:78-905(+)